MEMFDEDLDASDDKATKVQFTVLMVIVIVSYLVFMILGAAFFYDCPDTRLPIYIVVQGSTASVNCVSIVLLFWCYKRFFRYIMFTFPLIYVFDLIWSGIGFWWITTCSQSFLYQLAFGFTIPIPLSVLGFCCYCANHSRRSIV